MRSLVIYDTNFGHTRVIAEAISDGLGENSTAIHVSSGMSQDLSGVDLIVVGSPIIAWKPTERMMEYLNSISPDQLKGIRAASFDTRVKLFHGDAAKKISAILQEAGAEIIVEPEVFYVKGKQGPLFKQEEEKAAEWAKTIKNRIL